MHFESDDNEDDDGNLLGNDSSTESSDDGKRSRTLFPVSKKQASLAKSTSSCNFDAYLGVYDQIFSLFSRGEHAQWHSLFDQLLRQSSTPHQLLYLFLDHSMVSSNNKRQKLILPLIEQFQRNETSKNQIDLNETIKRDILSSLCRRCAFTQLEPIVNVFDLCSLTNQQIAIDCINEHLQQQQDLIFISQLAKILQLVERDAIPFEKIIVPLLLRAQWETIRFVIGNDKKLQRKLLETIDQLISTDKMVSRRLIAQCPSISTSSQIDTHTLKRAARRLLKQYEFDLIDFPNLSMQEKINFLKSLFVRKYLEMKNGDDESWNEQIKEFIGHNRDLQIKLIDLFVDYADVDAAVEWTRFYALEDFEIPSQVNVRREEIQKGDVTSRMSIVKPSSWPTKQQSETDVYQPTVLPSDIVYIELDSDVELFLNRLECGGAGIGSPLPLVGFDCETFMDPTHHALNLQIVSTIQLASSLPLRGRSVYGVLDMLALRLQLDTSSSMQMAELAQRLFCSHDFVLLTYNYAGDTSFLIENYPSMSEALMQGTAVIDLVRVQQYILDHCPEIFPYHDVVSTSKARGLSELVRLCFGKPLDKSMQTSDWRKRPLKEAQLIYSVLDARVLVDIAQLIEQRASALQISWSWSDFKGYTWTNKAFKKRTGLAQPQPVTP